MDYISLERIVEKRIKPSRLIHSLGVVEVAEALADRFGIDSDKARIAAIYHDAWRYSCDCDTAAFLEERGMRIEEEERKEPMLLHGALASLMISSDTGEAVSSDIRTAIRHHTLGHKDMGRLGAVIYIADYTEKNRKHITDEERKAILSLSSLEEMVKHIIDMQRIYFMHEGITEARVTGELYDYIEGGGTFS